MNLKSKQGNIFLNSKGKPVKFELFDKTGEFNKTILAEARTGMSFSSCSIENILRLNLNN